MSLRPFITPAPVPEEDEGVESDDQKRTKSMIVSAEDDAVYKWGRNVQVDWRMVIYVTLRDQVCDAINYLRAPMPWLPLTPL